MKYILSMAALCLVAVSFYACEKVQSNEDVENPMADNYEEQHEDIPEGEIDSAVIEIDKSSEMLEYQINTVEDEMDLIVEDVN